MATVRTGELLRILAEEWKTRDHERETLITRKVHEYDKLEKQLRATMKSVEERDAAVRQREQVCPHMTRSRMTRPRTTCVCCIPLLSCRVYLLFTRTQHRPSAMADVIGLQTSYMGARHQDPEFCISTCSELQVNT